MSIYSCHVLTKIEILREFQDVKNKAHCKRFPVYSDSPPTLFVRHRSDHKNHPSGSA